MSKRVARITIAIDLETGETTGIGAWSYFKRDQKLIDRLSFIADYEAKKELNRIRLLGAKALKDFYSSQENPPDES